MGIEEERKIIDNCDREIVRLLGERAKAAVAIGQEKRKKGLSYYDAGRQKKILDRLCRLNKGDFPESGVRYVFTEVMSACLNLEQQMTIAFLGPEMTFSHLAAQEVFGTSAECVPYKDFGDVFMACEKDWTNYGVVPIENSSTGVINDVLDRFVDTDLIISSETTLSVHQALMANCPLEDIKRIYSKAEPFLQCRAWLKENLPGVELEEVDSTSEGAKMAASSKNCGAIASEQAAKLHDLKVLVRGIEDVKDNVTRFWVIGKNPAAPTGDDKTSIMFSVKDRPGALYDVLEPFHRERINLTKIESRPTRRRAWEYLFFVDLQGHQSDDMIGGVIEEIQEHCEFMKVMGSYPRNDQPH